MTAKELKEMLSAINFNSFTDEELNSVHDILSTKDTEIKCILIRREHMRIRHPLPKDKVTN